MRSVGKALDDLPSIVSPRHTSGWGIGLVLDGDTAASMHVPSNDFSEL